jgi:D-alanyl-D-alanine carboxypeptidase
MPTHPRKIIVLRALLAVAAGRSLRRFNAVLTLVALFTWGLVGVPSASATLPALNHDAVLAAIPGVVAAGAPSFIMHAVDESGEWSAGAGVADLKTGAPASPDAAFRIGSTSKTFVAVAILQLVNEGKIGLDTPVATYLPGLLARGDVITIRELLQHRAGLGTTGFGTAHGRTWYPAIGDSCRNDFDPVAVIKAADVQLFEPGTGFNYANAGYTTLGLVIDKVTGESYEEFLRDRIIVPLGLTHTSFQEGAPSWPGPYLHGYGNFQPGGGNYYQKHYSDVTTCEMSILGAAGSGISTTRDLTTFLHALMHGALLPTYLYQQMIDTVPTDEGYSYGLGIFTFTRCGIEMIGHGGDVFGYETDLYATADGTRTYSSEMPLYPGTDAINAAWRTVNNAEICGS